MFGSIRAAPAGAGMCSVQYLREFIKERLTAACEEIFSEVQKTFVQYEEEIDRQRRLLDISRKPDTHSHITDPPQQHDCKEEEGLGEQQVCNQERNSNLYQEDPEPPPEVAKIKEEQEEHCSSQEGEQLELKQEPEGIWSDEEQLRLLETIWKPEIKLQGIALQQQHVCEEEEVLTEQQVCNQKRNSSLDQKDPEPPQIKEEQEELWSSQEGEQLGLKQEADTFIVMPTCEESGHSEAESNSWQLFSRSAPDAENQDQEEGQPVDSRSIRKAERKKRRHHSHRVDNTPVSEHQSQTDTRKKSLLCDTCGKTFHKKSNLTRHLRVHTGEKPYSCSSCEKSFSILSVLKTHMRIHTGEKPYPCSTCGKRFIQNTHLQRHMRIHTKEKPYSCSTCGKKFNQKSILKTHVRIHTGEKPHSCGICGRKFSQHSILKAHIKIHTDEKPHSCSICGKRFIQRTNLKTHMRIHTG